MSAETAASRRPTRGIPPLCSRAATRSAAKAAARRAASSHSSLTARRGEVTLDAGIHRADGRCLCSSSTVVAHARSEMAKQAVLSGIADKTPFSGTRDTTAVTSGTGSSASDQGTMAKRSSAAATRGASRPGTTSTGSPSRGKTSMVRRSRGMAQYPVSQGRSAPCERSRASTPSMSMRSRTRSIRARRAETAAADSTPSASHGSAGAAGSRVRTTGDAKGTGTTSGTGSGGGLDRLPGVVARAGERGGLHVGEAEGATRVPQLIELGGGPIAGHRHVGGARPQVLADGYDVDTDGPESRPGWPPLRQPSPPCRR